MSYELISDRIKRQEQFLQEAVTKYGTNPMLRGITPSGKRSYLPTAFSPGCVIGTHLNPDKIYLFQWERSRVEHLHVNKVLPDWMQTMSIQFLAMMQTWHDTPAHWDKNGLTKEGREYAQKVSNLFCGGFEVKVPEMQPTAMVATHEPIRNTISAPMPSANVVMMGVVEELETDFSDDFGDID